MKKVFFLLTLLLTLQGCENDISDTEQFVAKVKLSKGIAIEAMPEPAPFKHFEYSAGFLRSPFVAPSQELTQDVISQSRDCLQPELGRTKSVLEAYAIDNLVMRGSLGDSNALWALVQTIDGDVHKVKKVTTLAYFMAK